MAIRRLQNLLMVLTTGYIFFYFSELLFWARPRPGDSLTGWLFTWLAYSLMAFVFLALVSSFRVKDRWGLFLAGAAFGWIAEGVIVQTAYEMLPLSISFTGLAWHALITVWIGWYALQKSLLSPQRGSTLITSALIGLGYGLWATSWWDEPDGAVAPAIEFVLFSFSAVIPAIVAYWLANRCSAATFAPPRWTIVLVSALLTVYFIFVTIPAAPLAALLLPALLGLVFLGLVWNRRKETDGSLFNILHSPVPAWKYLSLLAIPATAILVYTIALALDMHLRTNWVLYLAATPLGFILFAASLYHTWRRKIEPD